MSWRTQADRLLVPQLEAFTNNGAELVRDEIVAVMEDSSPSGVFYRSRGHRASAEGEPPAVEEGDYVDSWKVSPAVQAQERLSAGAYTDLMADDGRELRAIYLEHGTEAMGPRPHIAPGTERAKEEIGRKVRRMNARAR